MKPYEQLQMHILPSRKDVVTASIATYDNGDYYEKDPFIKGAFSDGND